MLTTCAACGAAVSPQAMDCPNCGHPLRPRATVGDKVWLLVKATFWFGIAAMCFSCIPH